MRKLRCRFDLRLAAQQSPAVRADRFAVRPMVFKKRRIYTDSR
jgi:hypothetical protein